MSTTGWVVGTRVASHRARRAPAWRRGPLGRAAFALEHEAAHRTIDRCEVAVEELLGVVRLGRDVRALAELEHRFERGRPVLAGTRDDEAVVLGGAERLGVELAQDVGGESAHVLALERAAGRDCARVARRVAVALLDLGRRDDDVIDAVASALSAAPVTSHVSPSNASTASSVSRVPPSWLIATSTSASGAFPSTTSSACAAARMPAPHGTTSRSR